MGNKMKHIIKQSIKRELLMTNWPIKNEAN